MTDVPEYERLERQISDLHARVKAVEITQVRYDRDDAVRAAQAIHLDERFDRIEKRLDKGDSNISRLVWIVGAAVLSAIVGFLLKGGLNVPAI